MTKTTITETMQLMKTDVSVFESRICHLVVLQSYLSSSDLVGLSSVYVHYGHVMPFGLILLLITVYSCEILWVWIFTSAPRGATSSASRSVRFPMAFQNRRCFNLSNMMLKCLKICLTSAGSWPDHTWSRYDSVTPTWSHGHCMSLYVNI